MKKNNLITFFKMLHPMTNEKKMAILIDGDNAQSCLLEKYISAVEKYGRITVKRIYGDFTDNNKTGWKNQLNNFSIRPIQQFSYTSGKNSTDMALIIDAMDLLYSNKIDGFCIVSSDSDFTRIASRIKEEGLFIMGIGKKHTPMAFVKACDEFIVIETMEDKIKNIKIVSEPLKVPKINVVQKIYTNLIGNIKKPVPKKAKENQIETAFQMVADKKTGQVLLSCFSVALRKIDPDFNYKNLGYSSFKKFCMSLSPKYQIVLNEEKNTLLLKKGV